MKQLLLILTISFSFWCCNNTSTTTSDNTTTTDTSTTTNTDTAATNANTAENGFEGLAKAHLAKFKTASTIEEFKDFYQNPKHYTLLSDDTSGEEFMEEYKLKASAKIQLQDGHILYIEQLFTKMEDEPGFEQHDLYVLNAQHQPMDTLTIFASSESATQMDSYTSFINFKNDNGQLKVELEEGSADYLENTDTGNKVLYDFTSNGAFVVNQKTPYDRKFIEE